GSSSARPQAAEDSISARPESSRHPASTGAPCGPVTVASLLAPPNASRNPSPPSDIGTATASYPACRTPAATAAHACPAVSVPRNLSIATTIVMRRSCQPAPVQPSPIRRRPERAEKGGEEGAGTLGVANR